MEQMIPASFLETLAGVLLLFSIVIGFISFCGESRSHSVKLLAIFCVTSLAIFANNAWTYFVAIFVIATAITELDFLQNLAAIVRGNKEYFDYKKETLSKEDKISKVAQDVVEASIAEDISKAVEPNTSAGGFCPSDQAAEPNPIFEADNAANEHTSETTVEKNNAESIQQESDKSLQPEIPDSQISSDLSFYNKITERPVRAVKDIYELEGYALDKVQTMFSYPIERSVRFAREGTRIEVDGVMADHQSGKDILFEVKYLRSNANFIHWIRLVGKQLEVINEKYKAVTGKSARTLLVLVTEDDTNLTLRQLTELKVSTRGNYLVYKVGQILP